MLVSRKKEIFTGEHVSRKSSVAQEAIAEVLLINGRNQVGSPAEADLGYVLSTVIQEAHNAATQCHFLSSQTPCHWPLPNYWEKQKARGLRSVHFLKELSQLMIIFCMGAFLFNGFS